MQKKKSNYGFQTKKSTLTNVQMKGTLLANFSFSKHTNSLKVSHMHWNKLVKSAEQKTYEDVAMQGKIELARILGVEHKLLPRLFKLRWKSRLYSKEDIAKNLLEHKLADDTEHAI